MFVGGCVPLQVPQTQEGKIQQAAAMRSTFELAKADAQVLCDKQVLSPETCGALYGAEDLIEPVLGNLETAAQTNQPFDYTRLLYDLQPKLLSFVIDVSRARRVSNGNPADSADRSR